ncbi:hypothetical protein ABW20_dc0110640 [Dactylellina cionopaga]|nr:hypothetical protein ABW20_dc0110640 [Dactylellina cionopaga]
MIGLTSLPAELLNQIFEDRGKYIITLEDITIQPTLSKDDLRNLSLACKFLYNATYTYLGRNEIYLGLVCGSTMVSLLRRLLVDEEYGKTITHLRFHWNVSETVPWVPHIQHKSTDVSAKAPEDRVWTGEELAKLQLICERYGLKDKWRIRIESSPTSLPEILIVPILCLLPSLQDLVLEGYGAYGTHRIHRGFLTKYIRRLLPDNKSEITSGGLFKYCAPGLLSLSKFTLHGYEIWNPEKGMYTPSIGAEQIYPIFCLPKIREINLLAIGGNYLALSQVEAAGIHSTATSVSFHQFTGSEADAMSVISFCTQLEHLCLFSERRTVDVTYLKNALKKRGRPKNIWIETPRFSWECGPDYEYNYK